MSYAELLCCSNFSFQDGASHPQELVRRAKALGYTALAITDECTVAGIVRAHEAATEVDLKLIIGSQFRFPEGDRIVLLAPTQSAYAQICELITRQRRASEKGHYTIVRADFESDLDQCIGVWLPAKIIHEDTAHWFARLTLSYHAFGFVHVLEQHSERTLAHLQFLGETLDVPITAMGDARYHIRERRDLHDVLTAIRLKRPVDKIGRAALPNGERHLRPLSTLRKLYPAPLLETACAIADRCTFSLKSLHYEYPKELVPEGISPIDHLRALTEEGARRRWPEGTSPEVCALIEKELALIEELKFEFYFLTVEEIVRYARGLGILCQGRGSAANSAVCYALGVTEVDPARISVLFERFISRERSEAPDIDIDFEHQRREEVIQHIYSKYGRDRAAIAATVITYRHRSAVKDVGKALGLPLDIVETLAKSLYWFDGSMEIPAQLLKLGFDSTSRIARTLLRLVGEIVGFPRHLSQHVGGFVISQHPLSTLVPVENAAMPDRSIIQWDKNDLETLGLLKVDCLALGMLTALRRALDLKSKFDEKLFRVQDIPAEDPSTYDMMCKAETVGVFQIESRAQMAMLPRLRPREFFDVVIQIAIIRPGPIQGDMVNPYLRRRQGLDAVVYPNSNIEQVLKCTLGVPLFQEQVMQVAMVAAGFSAGEADKVRRSMAAWQRRGGLEQFRDQLRAGMLERGYTEKFSDQIYQQILGFGSYGFPMSHAASFAGIAYSTAWMRCHSHPAFVAGLLNSWPMGFYAPAQLINDARRNGVQFRTVDVQRSEWDCTLERNEHGAPEVRIGFRLIAGLGEAECALLTQTREQAPFVDLPDLARRSKIERRTLYLLAQAGALETLAGHRRAAHWAALGIEQLPPLLCEASAQEPHYDLNEPTEADNLVADYRRFGFSLGRHPMALLRRKLTSRKVARITDLRALNSGRKVRIAGVVTHRQRPETASGVIFLSMEDETGIGNLVIFSDAQRKHREPVFAARALIVQGELQNEAGVIHVLAERLYDCSGWLGALSTHSRDFQ